MTTPMGPTGGPQESGPEEANRLHRYDDLDSSETAHHHTLGRERNQAASGEHVHNGKDSSVLHGYSKIDHEHTVDGSLLMPTGSIVMWAGSSGNVPSGYQLCDGRALSRAAYPTLFSIIGTTYGAGDGSSTFNLPDMRTRFVRGASAANLGVVAGSDTHSHGTTSHDHGTNGHTHNASFSGNSHSHTEGSHSHSETSHWHDYSHSHTISSDTASNHQHTYTQGVNGAAATTGSGAHSHGGSANYINVSTGSGGGGTTGSGAGGGTGGATVSGSVSVGTGYEDNVPATTAANTTQNNIPVHISINYIIRTG